MKEVTLDQMVRLYVALAMPRARDERGDVPGWVMITVMTIGIGVVLWQVAGERLETMLNTAFDKVQQ